MGSLTSGPSAPTPQPQVVFVPQTISAPTQTPAPTTPTTPTQTAQETSAEARRQNLLGRERSRFGTVTTSFRGLLGTANQDSAQARKTLLGE